MLLTVAVLSVGLAAEPPRRGPVDAGPPLPAPTTSRDLPDARPGRVETPNFVPANAEEDPPMEAYQVELGELEVLDREDARWPRAVKDVDRTTCTMRVWIDETGNPLRADAYVCDPRFVLEGRRTALLWRFEPYELDGDPVPVVTLLPIEFER
ncbi:MAG: hypothetical protein ACOZNI_04605 [Myxococcota bacterium]